MVPGVLQPASRQTVPVLWFATWCAFLCVGIPLAVLPRYVHGELGGGDVAAGFAVGSLSLAAMLMRPWGGRLADERSRRLVVTGGLALCTVGGMVLLVSQSYFVLIVARMIAGAGESWVYAAAMAWALDLTPKDRHGSAIALFGMAIWLGATAGTAIGEGLLEWTGSYEVIWASVVAIPFIGLLVMTATGREAARPSRRGPRAPLILRVSVRPGIALALANVGYGAVASLVTLLLISRGVGSPGLTLTAVAAGVVIARLVVAWWLDRTGPFRVLVVGCVLQALGLLAIAGAHTLVTALLGGALLGCGYAAVFPALGLIVVNAAPDDQRGSALGGFTAFLDLGLAVGGPLAGLMAAWLGRPEAFVVAAGLTMTALLVAPRDADHRPVAGAPRVPAESELL
jgi:MFS family permease